MAQKKYKKTERRPGIKEYATELLLSVSFIDIYGRKVGIDYATILAHIRTKFPSSTTSPSHTTLKELQKIAYALNATGVPLPARRRSRKILVRDFIRSQLVAGKSYQAIRAAARRRFPGVPLPASLDMVRAHLVRARLLPPKQRAKQ